MRRLRPVSGDAACIRRKGNTKLMAEKSVAQHGSVHGGMPRG
jgi:hypothetical protein